MSETLYAWEVKAQLWREDPYYVASSMPFEHLTVVAPTREQAFKEARKVLGPAPRYLRWKAWLISSKDIRLVSIERPTS